jgi:hypothetical protein
MVFQQEGAPPYFHKQATGLNIKKIKSFHKNGLEVMSLLLDLLISLASTLSFFRGAWMWTLSLCSAEAAPLLKLVTIRTEMTTVTFHCL